MRGTEKHLAGENLHPGHPTKSNFTTLRENKKAAPFLLHIDSLL